MIEIELNEKNLDDFLKDIRINDELELRYFFKDDFKKQFKTLCLRATNCYFVADRKRNPIAIGGFERLKNENIAQGWLLCTNKLNENKKELYKYIKNKVNLNKEKYDIIYNRIYRSNFLSLAFIKSLGFKVVDLDDTDFKLFYFIKGDKKFDLRYFTDK